MTSKNDGYFASYDRPWGGLTARGDNPGDDDVGAYYCGINRVGSPYNMYVIVASTEVDISDAASYTEIYRALLEHARSLLLVGQTGTLGEITGTVKKKNLTGKMEVPGGSLTFYMGETLYTQSECRSLCGVLYPEIGSEELPNGTEDTPYTISKATMMARTNIAGSNASVTGVRANHGASVERTSSTVWTITPPPNFNGILTVGYGVNDGASNQGIPHASAGRRDTILFEPAPH